MRLADFISSNLEPILGEWEIFARSIGAGGQLNQLALRDHAGLILKATARDMRSPQTAAERSRKSKGLNNHHGSDALDGASDAHAIDRLSHGFDMMELMSEYRALRASVLHLWHDSMPDADDRDIDDLTRFNESIDQSLSQSISSYTRRVEQARDTFLAILGHDLRNPLNAMSMAATLIPLVRADEAEIAQCTSIIASSATLMNRMISDLLDFTRTRLGTGMPIKPAPLNLSTLGKELVTECQISHPSRQIEFREEGDLIGLWDSDRIRQALSNLVGNAIQHGASLSPVSISMIGEASKVFITVHNSGEPIPPAEIHNIFDPLVRGSASDEPQSNRTSSIGLGLYISREVARSHGGEISVTSTAADGTSFLITLPREAEPPGVQTI